MYSREYLREEMLKGIRVLEARIDAAAPPEQGDPARDSQTTVVRGSASLAP